ncbi:phospholipase ABHD3 [Bactrocera dorsalis]|uniref:Phospholipase ABHD3 n=1 Tax=Bactrocera dorsalis TaxID=27457 RepID=A0ABM3JN19_BACDO|nr:phospholipase ABHD3 [Bactrocera dorsalis]XP_049310629.1 phospholipase ABHD3 [Bactrocera dorsalis]XP_049310630.1 phospholipase ABHD3 [Bactrocera dorsalis]XP_049310631.1 phospholipase ABHD3 [Bactrocera dorsalis]XP_049310632.1 phospholipase ABHD3 [Bactrocera dorsalis]XP_049310633.1 phospholipase ABHD3 [Bactrocera dorsalis]
MLDSLYNYWANLPGYHVLGFGLIAYFTYYLILVVKRPTFVCAEGPLKNYLLREIPTLSVKFWPTFWCLDSRAQTVFASVLRSKVIPPISYKREIYTLKDGGEVALDWMDTNCNSNSPCIIILPGLTGNSQDEYVKCLVYAANNSGIRVIVFNNRGLGGVTIKTPRLYNACNCEDLAEVVQHVRNVLPAHCKIGATGVSMGGLVLGNYLARRSQEARTYLSAAKIISVPWNVHKAIDSIEQPILNNLLGRILTQNMYRTLMRSGLHEHQELDMKSIKTCKTIREFDTNFTIKHFGYPSVEDYYNDATLQDKLHHISVPLLCLSAADDPFQPLDAIPIKAANESSHVAIIVTARGGHIGFLEGCFPSAKDQYISRVFVEYFTKALFDEEGEFQRIKEDLHRTYFEKHSDIKA